MLVQVFPRLSDLNHFKVFGIFVARARETGYFAINTLQSLLKSFKRIFGGLESISLRRNLFVSCVFAYKYLVTECVCEWFRPWPTLSDSENSEKTWKCREWEVQGCNFGYLRKASANRRPRWQQTKQQQSTQISQKVKVNTCVLSNPCDWNLVFDKVRFSEVWWIWV